LTERLINNRTLEHLNMHFGLVLLSKAPTDRF